MSRIAIKTDREGFKELCVGYLLNASKDEDVSEVVENIYDKNGDAALLDVPHLDKGLYLRNQSLDTLVNTMLAAIACYRFVPNVSDFKIDVNGENYEFERFLEVNGTYGFIMFMGGDWESPVNAFIYFDQKKQLRVYIPKSALYNHKTKKAYGNADEEDDWNDAKKVYEQYNFVPSEQTVYGIYELMKFPEYKKNIIEDITKRITT